MESLNDFFEDWEKEYSQQVVIPESEVIKDDRIKTRRYSLNTEKLKQNAKDRAARAKARLHRAAFKQGSSEKRKSSQSSKKSKRSTTSTDNYIDDIPVKSNEYTLKANNRIAAVINKYK